MWMPLSIVCLVLLAMAAAACLALWLERRRLMAERSDLAARNDSLERALSERKEELARVSQKFESAQQEQADLKKLLEEAKTQFRDTFDALAGKALKESRQELVKQARQVFEHEQQKAGKQLEANKQAVESLIKPVKESLQQYQQTLTEAEKQRHGAYQALHEQAKQLADGQAHLQQETAKLVKALRRPEIRGRWGELHMERLFELAGMTQRVDYDEQAKVDSGETSVRPDYTIYLPNDRVIVIDVKTPIDAYLDATEAEDEATRAQHLDRHARQLRTAADNLASKSYWSKCKGSPEFVVMFVPGESMLYGALQREPELIEAAMARNVIIATPTVVMALLKTVAMGWREKAWAENAEKIAQLGRELHERLATVVEHVGTLGSRLDSAVKQYNAMVGSIDARLMPAARRFEQLEADSSKQLGESVEPLERLPRQIQGPPRQTGDNGDG